SEVKVSVTRAPAKTVEVASISLVAPDTALQLGESVQLEAIARDKAGAATSSTISWLSSDPTVVSVDPTGLAQAVGVGAATVTAFSGGKTAVVSLSVARAAVASVAINPARLDLTPGQVAPLAASFADAAGAALTGRSEERRVGKEHSPGRGRL